MQPPALTDPRPRRQEVIGHRGASAYAPEHTLRSYELALQQGADAVEQDLHVTKDGVLVCLHDRTLERTTNVRDVFPDRARACDRGPEAPLDGHVARHWFVHDFTLDELKRLDSGAWFGAEFAGSTIPTFQEVVECVGDRGRLCVELKDPEVYETFGVDMLSLFATLLRGSAIDRPRSGMAPWTVQTFHEPTLRRAAAMLPSARLGAGDRRLVLVLLIEPADADRWSACAGSGDGDRDWIRGVADFADGIGPGKAILEARPEVVRWAHEAGLIVTPWTFRAAATGRFESVRAEMAYYLSELDVDAVITDNPDQFPRPPA